MATSYWRNKRHPEALRKTIAELPKEGNRLGQTVQAAAGASDVAGHSLEQ